jgi:hypothetical protein
MVNHFHFRDSFYDYGSDDDPLLFSASSAAGSCPGYARKPLTFILSHRGRGNDGAGRAL